MTSSDRDAQEEASTVPSVYTVAGSDPRSELVDRSGLDATEIAHIDELMSALGRLRDTEKRLSEASQDYMQLNETDMRALHFLIVCENTGTLATPGAIAHSLGISSASTTKLLDRLERGGHIHRGRHPSDRRALVISIDPATRSTAMRTVGAQQARRVHAARRLSAEERDIVIAFLEDMAAEISVDGADWAGGRAADPGSE